MANPDRESHELDQEQSQEQTLFDVLNKRINLTRVYEMLRSIRQDDPPDQARKEVDSVSYAIQRVTRDIENGKATKDEYFPILNEYAPQQQDPFLFGRRVVHKEILLTLTQEGLLDPQCDDSIEIKDTDDTGRVTRLVQYQRTRLAPVVPHDPDAGRYEWMIRSSRIPALPDRLVLRRVNPTIAPKQ